MAGVKVGESPAFLPKPQPTPAWPKKQHPRLPPPTLLEWYFPPAAARPVAPLPPSSPRLLAPLPCR